MRKWMVGAIIEKDLYGFYICAHGKMIVSINLLIFYLSYYLLNVTIVLLILNKIGVDLMHVMEQ
jgi:hypothetical protein